MCGRYTLTHPVGELGKIFDFAERPNLPARYNIAPTQSVPAVRVAGDDGQARRELFLPRWGLVPSWADDPAIGNRLINARGETVLDKASFRNAMRKRRCLVLADGFYEWTKREDGKKQPFRIARPDRQPFAFAGLWDVWKGPKGQPLDAPLETVTIITTAANATLRPLHDRMPVVLDPADYDLWLDAAAPAELAADLLRPCPDDWLETYPVALRVNSVRHDDPACIEPLVDEPRLF